MTGVLAVDVVGSVPDRIATPAELITTLDAFGLRVSMFDACNRVILSCTNAPEKGGMNNREKGLTKKW